MSEIMTWIVLPVIGLLALHMLVVRGMVIPHAFAVRRKLRDKFGRDPDPVELSRYQAFWIGLVLVSEAHPTLLGGDIAQGTHVGGDGLGGGYGDGGYGGGDFGGGDAGGGGY